VRRRILSVAIAAALEPRRVSARSAILIMEGRKKGIERRDEQGKYQRRRMTTHFGDFVRFVVIDATTVMTELCRLPL
jgi:hypothetical protein